MSEEQRRAGPGRPRADRFRAWYTLPALALLAGVTVRELEGALPADLIEQPDGPGTKRRVYVRRLKDGAVEFWESVLDRLHAVEMAARADPDERREDEAA